MKCHFGIHQCGSTCNNQRGQITRVLIGEFIGGNVYLFQARFPVDSNFRGQSMKSNVSQKDIKLPFGNHQSGVTFTTRQSVKLPVFIN